MRTAPERLQVAERFVGDHDHVAAATRRRRRRVRPLGTCASRRKLREPSPPPPAWDVYGALDLA